MSLKKSKKSYSKLKPLFYCISMAMLLSFFALSDTVLGVQIRDPFESKLPVIKQPDPVQKVQPRRPTVTQPRTTTQPSRVIKNDQGNRGQKTVVTPRRGAKQQITKPVRPDIIVSGIVFSGETAQAIINGRVVNEGMAFGQSKIVKISKDGVHVQVGPDTYVYKIHNSIEAKVTE